MNSSLYGSSALPAGLSSADEPVLDPGILADLQRLQPRNGVAFLNRLLQLYRDTLDKHEHAIASAWPTREFNVVQDSAHALKSASANIGAHALAQICQALEQALRQGQPDAAAPLIPLCLEAMQRTARAVDEHLGRSA